MEFNNPTITTPDLRPPSSIRLEDPVESQRGSSPVKNLRTYAVAAVATLIAPCDTASNESLEIRFLLDHLEAVSAMEHIWPESISSYLDRPNPCDAPLIRLAGEIGLRPAEILAVALAAAVEDDVMLGRALAHLQAPLGGSRPTLGLIAAALLNARILTDNPISALLTGVAVQSGLLTVIGDSAPMPERAVGVPLPLCLALNGHDASWPGAIIGLGDIPEVPLPASIAQEAERQTKGLLSCDQKALVLRTGSTAEGKSVASRIAHSVGRRAVFIETEKTSGLGPWLILRELLPVFCLALGPGERKTLPSLHYYRGPVLALCGPDGSVEAQGGTALSWSLPVPPMEERRQLWEVALGDGGLADDLARHHRHGSGRIAHLGRLIRHRTALNSHSRPTSEDVAAASWVTEGASLDALAQPLTDAIPDEALIMMPTLRNEMETLLLRCRARDTLARDLGASATARYKPGVRALFVGPSGTGKTLAAGWLATRLGLPLYRVDLASVTSKYIGETEKNLAQLLARAEQAEVVLLFDEADSLFGKRTDVKDANDRFANAQTNYLLQRIEYFDGITLLTSNSRSRFDSAFSRRLDIIVDFPAPGPEERRLLWQSHLGTNHHLAQRDLNQLAATADVNGGHIRNVILTAAVFAQNEGRLIKYDDIIQALTGEYRKQGRQMPLGLKTRI